ncbi:hypothetical protein HK097_005345 [Rhizophlyctis rosea]|uniref:Arylsulfatase n=1 Tax=Rhizophlyctis rosea TaxID=64517 RepID=A0AAD5SM66_9FUNG|nr:hypothetical protein HK097_005345 [Rhizophlyctis rosea]
MKFTTILSSSLALAAAVQGAVVKGQQPNIVLLLSDDQDVRMDSLKFMPHLKKHLIEGGTLFENHFVTTAICCPSRVSLLRGQFAHNTNFTDVFGPHGGYDKFLETGLNDDYLPKWLKAANYNTYYIGKFLNGYGLPNLQKLPGGWDVFDALVNPWIYDFYHPVFSRNGEEAKHYKGVHQVDVIAGKALNILDEATKKDEPFFLYLAPSAPHTTVAYDDPDQPDGIPGIDIHLTAHEPPRRFANHFPEAKIPRNPNFNTANVTGKPRYISSLPVLNDTVVDTLDHWYRQRLRGLQAVDELLDSVVKKLDEAGVLDNTYIFYSTDNGYHIGTHRLNAGKTTPYEEDVNVPFLVRGPGVARNVVKKDVTTHTDIAPTFLKLAGTAPKKIELDGRPIPVHAHESRKSYESFGIEFWRPIVPEYYDIPYEEENTYRSVRVVSEDYSYQYTVWCTGHHELYNHTADPYQLHNLYPHGHVSPASYTARVIQRLDALLSILYDCIGSTCRDPWRRLHPDGSVKSLNDALADDLDSFYASGQAGRLIIDECLDHQKKGNEHVTKQRHEFGRFRVQGVDEEMKMDEPWQKKPRNSSVQRGKTRKEFTGHVETEGNVEDFGVPLTKVEVELAHRPNAYDYD